jgi:hypothetical protein
VVSPGMRWGGFQFGAGMVCSNKPFCTAAAGAAQKLQWNRTAILLLYVGGWAVYGGSVLCVVVGFCVGVVCLGLCGVGWVLCRVWLSFVCGSGVGCVCGSGCVWVGVG